MQRSALIVVGVVILASLVGAVGSGAAQSDENLVTLTLDTVVESSNQQVGGVTLVVSWDGGGQERVTTRSNGQALVDVPEGATVEITLDDDEYTRNEPYRIRVATERQHTIGVARQAEVDIVVNDAEGPVADTRVALIQEGTTVVSGRTGSDGRFQSGTIAQGTYTVSAVKPGYYRTTEEVIVAGSPEKTVRIERGRVDYDIVVEDPYFDTARPVSDATVSIQRVGDLTTDDRGAAATLLPVNTEVQVTVSKDGYETATRTISVSEREGSATFAISRDPSLSLTAVNQRIVVGEVVPVEVTNAYDEPAAGVTILYDGEPVGETNAEGRLRVRVDSTGEHEISARRDGTTSDPVTVTGIEGAADEGTTASETGTAESGTTVASGDSGLGLDGLLPIVALVVGLLLLVVLAVVFLRRRRTGPEPNPDFGLAGGDTASGGNPGTDTATGPSGGTDTGTAADAAAGTDAAESSGAGSDADAGAGASDADTSADAESGGGSDADEGATGGSDGSDTTDTTDDEK